MTKRTIAKNILGLCIFAGFAILVYVYCSYLDNRVRNHHLITKGKIEDYHILNGRTRSIDIEFAYYINGEIIEGGKNSYSLGTFSDATLENVLVGRKFPVVYDSNNISNARMLILKSDFDKYDVPFPDSVKWVEGYVEHK
jgi:hypothetical protein